MDKRRRHRSLLHLSEIQNLQLAQARLGLADKQMLVSHAQEQHSICAERRNASELALDSLLEATTFCPDGFKIACEVLLIDEADIAESDSRLAEANQHESEQRVIWHRSRLQAEWLEEQGTQLGRKLLQAKEDKHLTETTAARCAATKRLF